MFKQLPHFRIVQDKSELEESKPYIVQQRFTFLGIRLWETCRERTEQMRMGGKMVEVQSILPWVKRHATPEAAAKYIDTFYNRQVDQAQTEALIKLERKRLPRVIWEHIKTY